MDRWKSRLLRKSGCWSDAMEYEHMNVAKEEKKKT